jgi:hypothetical protein
MDFAEREQAKHERNLAGARRAVMANMPKPNGTTKDAPQGNSSGKADSLGDWPKPEPLQGELPPVEPFSEDLLPRAFRALVTDVAERMQVPLDFPAVITVLCLAGVVSRRATIQPKAVDTGWVVTPNLWGGIINPPGFMKSPVITAITKPLASIEEFWRNEFAAALQDHEIQKEEADLRFSAWKDLSRQAIKKNQTIPIRPDNSLAEPVRKRLKTNDATFEKLHELMAQNPAGLILVRDELTGWLSMLDKQGREGERAFFLECWNGDSFFTADRIGRGTIDVPHCCMSILGGIQPGRLRSYLVDALKDGPSNDGLIQRFQLLVWPDTVSDWNYVDRPPDAAAEQQAAQVFRRLVELDAENPMRFRFAADAQELFVEWLADLEAKIRGHELHPALISHLSKFRKLMPALALLFELADRAAEGGFVGFGGSPFEGIQNIEGVSLEHTRQAAACCAYLETHARRIYSCITTPRWRAARELAAKIKDHKVGADGFFVCRDVYRQGWTNLDSPEAVNEAVEVLEDAGWVRQVSVQSSDPLGRGRPSSRYQINPRIWE